MREWESEFDREYGSPTYAQYSHPLLAHGPEMDNAQRTRAGMGFDHGLRAAVHSAGSGGLPAKNSFVQVNPENVLVSAFRSRPETGYELRLIETAGRATSAEIELGVPTSRIIETDLLGRQIGERVVKRDIRLLMKPW